MYNLYYHQITLKCYFIREMFQLTMKLKKSSTKNFYYFLQCERTTIADKRCKLGLIADINVLYYYSNACKQRELL